jgi:tetratricopeptide (TPR) repeat protein
VPNLDDAVAASRATLAAHMKGHARRPNLGYQLGALLLERYRTASAPEDLDEAILLLHEALTDLSPSSGGAVATAAALTDALLLRATRRTGTDDIDFAIRVLRYVIAGGPEEANVAVLLLKLCQALIAKHAVDGKKDTVDEAVARGRDAVAIVDQDNPVATRGVLAAALVDRYHLTVDPDDLDEAIDLLRDVAMAEDPNRAQVAAQLAKSLLTRAERTRHTGDVERAIAVLRDALDGAGRNPALLTMLGHALMRLHERTGDLAALESARTAFVDTIPDDLPEQHPNYRAALGNVAAVVERMHALTGDISLQEYAVGLRRHALARCPRGDAAYQDYLDSLGYALRKLYDATGSLAELRESTALFRESIAATPPGNPRRLRTRISLTQGLRAEHLRTGDRTGLVEAAEVAIEGGRLAAAQVSSRIDALTRAGHAVASLGEWARAMEVFGEAVTLLPRLASRGRTRVDQYHDLGEVAGLATDAAASALNAGRPDRALELLEHGRGVLLNQRLAPGGGLDPLRRADAGLAREYERLRREFDAPDAPGPATLDRDRDTEWTALVDRIRALPGLADFLRPATATQLLARVAGATVVLLAPATFRCDALILRDGRIEPLSLPELTLQAAVENVQRFQDATTAAHDLSTRPKARLSAQQTVREIMDWLWHTTVSPVLTHLGCHPTASPWPRLWWCPTGPMAFFPLHASGSTLDCVVSSYTPTVDALGRLRRRATGGGTSCVVAMARTPGGYTNLQSAHREAAVAAAALPGAIVEADTNATRDRVLASLTRSTHAHFACHAIADPNDPAMGRLLFHDHPLTVVDVSGLHLDAELAFLSACATTRAPLQLADEALHITGAFQLAGFRHVIGTLWETDDTASLKITSAFYSAGAPGDATPYALHAAVRALRTRYPVTPTLWAAHIHTGA